MDNYNYSSGVDTSPDMNSSVEVTSPERLPAVQPRKLTFNSSPEQDDQHINQENLLSPRKQATFSPPYRRVRALRLFDTPSTPKTIIEKSKLSKAPKVWQSILPQRHGNSSSDLSLKLFQPEKPKPVPLHNRCVDHLMHTANVNPFTPPGYLQGNKKRSRTHELRENIHNSSLPLFETNTDDEIRQAPKRLALQDSNISRFDKEFIEMSLIGGGEFGLVYQCLNRLDGCLYAIKKSIKPVAGSISEKTALNEVWAHAVLGKHDNVLRYYSAWAENNHMLIQNEYCNGGSLQDLLKKRFLSESELRTLLIQISEGLKYIHSHDLVHMDLKAGNIFLSHEPLKPDACDDGFEDNFSDFESDNIVTYKIGDLGHVTSIKDPHVEEGDCRYLPKEILEENFEHLAKGDIFALGITLYEAGGGGPLPKNGPEWHRLREGKVPNLPNISQEFNDLIKEMTHPNPDKRPSSVSIFNHPVFCMAPSKSKAELSRELQIERQRNEILKKKLKNALATLKSYEEAKSPVANKKSKYSPAPSDRKLRSYTKRKARSSSNAALQRRTLRDRNRNIIIDEF